MDPATLMALTQLMQMGKQVGQSYGNIGQGLIGDSGAPYQAAEKELNDFYNRAKQTQNPFYQAGTNAIPGYQNWVQGQQDPSGFINHLMNNYQESPWAKYQQDQAMRTAQNFGSAKGLTGSSPLMQFAQQQAAGISSQDMQNWLANVLGINTQYGQGEQNLMTGGQNAANQLTNINRDFGTDIATMQYNKNRAEQDQRSSLWGGLFSLM